MACFAHARVWICSRLSTSALVQFEDIRAFDRRALVFQGSGLPACLLPALADDFFYLMCDARVSVSVLVLPLALSYVVKSNNLYTE